MIHCPFILGKGWKLELNNSKGLNIDLDKPMLFQMFVDKIFCDFLLSSEQSFKPVPSFSAVYVPVGSEKSAVGPPPIRLHLAGAIQYLYIPLVVYVGCWHLEAGICGTFWHLNSSGYYIARGCRWLSVLWGPTFLLEGGAPPSLPWV